MSRERIHFALINAGHFLDHLTTLVFATVAVIAFIYIKLFGAAAPGAETEVR